MTSLPSPCLDICKFKRRGHCIACGMTKMQKNQYDSIRGGEAQKAFIQDLMKQQVEVGSAKTWAMEYARKCEKRGLEPPFELTAPDAG